ncbi:MAG TPA: agmatinase [Actinomycetota bacterium]|jgi:agmatinase
MRINRPGIQANFAGLVTFSDLDVALEPADLDGVDVAIVGAPIDETVTYRPGARFGPRAIRMAGYSASNPHLSAGVYPFDVLRVVDYGDAAVVAGDTARSHEAIRGIVREIAAAGVVPLVLGGDHSIAHPDLGGVADAVEPEAVGLVHFDAHADDADEIDGVKRSHGTPLRRLVEEGSLRGEHVVQIGLRGYWPGPEEFAWARGQGFRWYLQDEVDDRGIEMVIDETVGHLTGLPHVFLSVDIDVCDPAFSPGTGTPEPGGMTANDLLRAVRRLGTELPLRGMEIVEVAPPYDVAEVTALLAHRVALEALTGMALRRLGKAPEPYRDGRAG